MRMLIVIDMQNFIYPLDRILCMADGRFIDSYYIVKLAKDLHDNCKVALYNDSLRHCQIQHSYFSFDNCNYSYLTIDETVANISTDTTQNKYINALLLDCGENNGDDFTIQWQNIDFNTCLGIKQVTTAQLKNPDYLNSIYWYVNKEGES